MTQNVLLLIIVKKKKKLILHLDLKQFFYNGHKDVLLRKSKFFLLYCKESK